MKDPNVSVIVTTFNGENVVGRCLQSIFHQTYRNFEVIVVDDCSNDNTVSVLNRWKGKIKPIMEECNKGTMASRNIGAAQASGKYIAFLDQDDFFLPNKLAVQVKAVEENPSVGLTFGNMYLVDKEGSPIGDSMAYPPNNQHPPTWEELLQFFLLFPSSALLRRELFNEIGGFDTRFAYSGAYGDQDFHLRLREKAPFCFTDEIIGCYSLDEIRSLRSESFLDNLLVFAEKYWRRRDNTFLHHRNLQKSFVIKCQEQASYYTNHLIHDNNYSFKDLLLRIDKWQKFFHNLFGPLYKDVTGILPLRLNTEFSDLPEELIVLLFVYCARPSLHEKFPEASTGNFSRLYGWAYKVSTAEINDVSFPILCKFCEFFKRNAK